MYRVSNNTKTIILSAAVVAAVYVAVEFFAKPGISKMAGVKVK
jgi:hypothetical protein